MDMKSAFDANSIIVDLLKSGGIEYVITGKIYVDGSRPLNSRHEDIVVSVVAINVDVMPQVATSNINIYVPDQTIKSEGKNQQVANLTRLKELTDQVLKIIRTSIVPGIKVSPSNHIILEESSIHQHYSNIRLSWNIQAD